jgi:hypothetical protein
VRGHVRPFFGLPVGLASARALLLVAMAPKVALNARQLHPGLHWLCPLRDRVAANLQLPLAHCRATSQPAGRGGIGAATRGVELS